MTAEKETEKTVDSSFVLCQVQADRGQLGIVISISQKASVTEQHVQ